MGAGARLAAAGAAAGALGTGAQGASGFGFRRGFRHVSFEFLRVRGRRGACRAAGQSTGRRGWTKDAAGTLMTPVSIEGRTAPPPAQTGSFAHVQGQPHFASIHLVHADDDVAVAVRELVAGERVEVDGAGDRGQ